MADLLALADDETRALWADLRLGYTESTGHPLLRREIARALRDARARRRPRRSPAPRRRSSACSNVLLGPGDHAIVTWPGYQSLYEVARAAGADVTLHELREDATAGRSTSTASAAQVHAGDAAHRRQRAPQPDRDAARSRDVRRRWSRSPRSAGATSSSTRSTAASRSTPRDRLPAGADALERGISLGVMSKSFAMAGLRIGWLATPRPRPAGPLRGVQGLHDDLLVGAVGDPGAHRAAGARPGAGAVARGSSPATSAPRRVLRATGPTRSPGSGRAAGSIGFPRLIVPGVGSTSGPRGSSRPRACCSCPGSQFGRPGQPLPDRVRARGPARGAGPARSLRREDATVSIPARLGIVTLGVEDLARSIAFYEAIGWERSASSIDGRHRLVRRPPTRTSACSRATNWPRTRSCPNEPRAPFGGITLAINVETPRRGRAGPGRSRSSAGGTLLKPATVTDWGGTSGYVADPGRPSVGDRLQPGLPDRLGRTAAHP